MHGKRILLALAALGSLRLAFLYGLLPGGQESSRPRPLSGSLYFELNQGQVREPDVRFLARAPGYTVFLTSRELLFQGHRQTIRLRPRDAQASEPRPLEPRPGVVSYLRGSDPALWLRGLPTSGKVRYRELYPGIDMLCYGSPRHFEFDFVVAPGADPSRILLDIEAEVPLSLDPEGNLMLGGELFQPAPQIYQETSRGRQLVQGGFQLLGPGQVAFQLGPYDPGRPLVIDPLVYGTFLRGDRPQRPSAVAADPSTRHVAVTGSCVEPKEEDDDEDADVFVSKFDANGVLLYSTHFGGDEGESGLDIALDSTGQATITGGTGSLNFPIKGGLPNLTCRETDAFVTRLNPDGTDFVYSTLLGGEDDDRGVALALRPDGGVIVAGQTYSAKFPATPGAFQTVPASPPGGRQLDGFVAQLNTTGDRLLYATYLGGSEADFLQALAVDAEGNAAVTCMTHSEDFPTAGPLSTRLTGLHNAFVSRLDSEGKMLI